ncbi:ABC transporter permease subunit [Enterobacteriaceae endosymbiont of Macroplea appendiculata]|uniref:ABC transporter permease subunit n=1 Tax=Enterobacteriaceae endosymbiont of Macroplea appendiculata TaxID=2675790 RepID=UPI001448A731|nr:ABC transporter permease subunit [Enterobacteriaceae endosymbiont of Macroplea appendiculata]QJC31009.1 ABC transporter permease subunit [Enterobacteriaceae endosymbiont of Macroplea appendiculata]
MNNKNVLYIKKFICVIIIGWILLFMILPNILIIIISFMHKDHIHLFKVPYTVSNYLNLLNFVYLKIFLHSMYISLYTTIICLIIGYTFAWYLVHMSITIQSLMLTLLFIPFWINSLTRIYSLKIFFSVNGWFNKILIYLHFIKYPIHIIYTPIAIILGSIYILLPFMIMPIYTCLKKLDKSCIEAAKDLGASPYKIFLHVIIPLTSPGIIAGCLLVLLPSIGMFSIADLMGGSKNLLIGNIIKNEFLNIRNWPFGAALSNIMTIITVMFLLLYWKLKYICNNYTYKGITNNV